MESVPKRIDVDEIVKSILKVSGVVDIHELHINSLTGDIIISSLHLRIRSMDELPPILKQIKKIFHFYGIHTTTIQPECEPVKFVYLMNNAYCMDIP